MTIASATVQATALEGDEPTMYDTTKKALSEHVKISGFGSIVAGQANNDSNYLGYDDDGIELDADSLLGLQLEVKITDRLKAVTQIVAKGRYDYDIVPEMAYLSYEANQFTARAGILRTPFYMYSDYLDLGYAYPMLRPSDELYDNIIISTYEGMDLLIPIEFENSTLLLQPYAGVTRLDERDAMGTGETTFNDFYGLTTHWYVDDFTFRATYALGQSEHTAKSLAYNKVEEMLDDKKGKFLSLGAHYDNGNVIAMVEAAEIKLEGEFSDTLAVSGVAGYRFGNVTPYAAISYLKTTDDDERIITPRTAYLEALNYKTNSYSVGVRWDVYKNIALKTDVTYVDFNGIQIVYGHEDSLVYSTAIDFVF